MQFNCFIKEKNKQMLWTDPPILEICLAPVLSVIQQNIVKPEIGIVMKKEKMLYWFIEKVCLLFYFIFYFFGKEIKAPVTRIEWKCQRE